MKILEYLIWCTCTPSSISQASPSLPADDFVSVVQPESHYYRNKKKCSIKSSKSGSPTQLWRPSLKAISEDDIVAVNRRNSDMNCSAGTSLKQKPSPMHKSKVPSRWSEDFGGGAPIPGIIPAFAPTPFLF